ncbi:MAG TPA: hypothetical protein VFM78_11825, partial [Marinobacter sp.]|nr:hypothetical protein [Marinobacter sp.]
MAKSPSVALWLMMCAGLAHSETIRVGVGEEFASVVSVDAGRLKGELAAAYNCVFDGVNTPIRFQVLPHARLIHELRAGTVDVGLPLVHEASRDAFATLGDPVIQSNYLRVSLPDQTVAPEADSAKYVYLRGFAGGSILRELGGESFEVSRWEQAIAMLERGRADFLLITEKTFNQLSDNNAAGLDVDVIRRLDVSFYVANRH